MNKVLTDVTDTSRLYSTYLDMTCFSRLPGAVVNNRVILIRHSIEHSQFTKHICHDIQEALSSSSLHNSTEQGKGMGGVQKSGACM